ncbi:hypothetical protein D7M11_23495 [Paenibacillus ginsengarvi]|uniref:Uncharacterized protein n=1 Tax=Paenibacillus ginsengarvi TaxID=400777 RepID=A0A3B0C1G8_9BACL|nr:hypothetical protein D7M11_23495 [Paenibacillus ginsengarvi]
MLFSFPYRLAHILYNAGRLIATIKALNLLGQKNEYKQLPHRHLKRNHSALVHRDEENTMRMFIERFTIVNFIIPSS